MIIIKEITQVCIDHGKINCKDTITTFIHTKHKIKEMNKYEDDLSLITCPITQEIIENPIKLNQKYYEEAFIRKWIRDNHRDPVTNLEAEEKDLDDFITYKFNQRKYEKSLINDLTNKIIEDLNNYLFNLRA